MVVGNVAFAATSWLVLSILAHGGGAVAVGEFALAVAVTTPIMMFAQLRLRDVVATDTTGERPFSDYLTLTALTAVAAIPVVLVVAWLLEGWTPLLWTVLAWATARGIESLSLILYGLEQQRDEMSRVGRSMIARGVLAVILVAVVFSLTHRVALAAAAIASAYAAVLVLYDARGTFREILNTEGFRRPEFRALRTLAIGALPLGVFALLTSLNDNIPRLLLNGAHGIAALGVFGAFGFIIVGGSTVTRALGQAAGPRLAGALAKDDAILFRTQLLNLLGVAIGLAVLALAVAALFGAVFLRLAFGPEFAAHQSDFMLVVFYAGLLFMASPLTVALIAARRYRAQMAIQIAAVASVLLVGIVAIPPLGITGAALSLIAGGVVRVSASGLLLAIVVAEMGRQTLPVDGDLSES
jgi:O-antigen/teichoic acid export membrane protein